MADVPNPVPEKRNDNGRRDAWQKFLDDANPAPPAQNFRRDELMLRQPQGNCIRCHDTGRRDYDLKGLDLKPLDFGMFEKKPRLPEKPETPEQAEKRMVDQFNRATPLDKTMTVLGRLPEKASIKFDDKKLTLETDFAKFIEAVPGVHMDKHLKDAVQNIKSISLDGDRFTAALHKPMELNAGGMKIELGSDKNPNLQFDIHTEKNGDFSLSNIKGMKVRGLDVEKIALETQDGKSKIAIQSNMFGKPVTLRFDAQTVVPGLDIAMLRNMVGTLSDAKTAVQTKDLGNYVDGIPEEGLRNTLKSMVKGITSIEKNGDQYTFKRNNGTITHDLGGPNLILGSEVSFKLDPNVNAPSVKDLRGLTFSAPIPDGIPLFNGKYYTNIKGVSLGEKGFDGSRDVQVNTDNMVDSVNVRLTPNFTPRTYDNGNWDVRLRGQNPLTTDQNKKVDMTIRIGANGQPNMSTLEIADIAARVGVQAIEIDPKPLILGAATSGLGLGTYLYDKLIK